MRTYTKSELICDMRSIAFNRCGLAPANDKPALKGLFTNPKLRHPPVIPKNDVLEPIKQRFRYIVDIKGRFALVKINDQDTDFPTDRRPPTLFSQSLASGSRHPFAPSSARSIGRVGAAWRADNDKLHALIGPRGIFCLRQSARRLPVRVGRVRIDKKPLCGVSQSSSILLDKGQQRVPVGLQSAPTPAASIEHADPGRGGLDVELAVAHARDDRSTEARDKPLKAAGTVRAASQPIADDADPHPPGSDASHFFDAVKKAARHAFVKRRRQHR